MTGATLEKWMMEQKRHRLFDKQVQMARELGLNPGKLGKIDNHKQDHRKKSQRATGEGWVLQDVLPISEYCCSPLRQAITACNPKLNPKPSV